VEIVPPDRFEEVAAGTIHTLVFTLRNHGASDTFQIIAVDSTGIILQAQPAQLMIPQNGSAKVTVPLNIAADKPAGSGVTVTMTATSTSNPEITNGMSLELSVAGR